MHIKLKELKFQCKVFWKRFLEKKKKSKKSFTICLPPPNLPSLLGNRINISETTNCLNENLDITNCLRAWFEWFFFFSFFFSFWSPYYSWGNSQWVSNLIIDFGSFGEREKKFGFCLIPNFRYFLRKSW